MPLKQQKSLSLTLCCVKVQMCPYKTSSYHEPANCMKTSQPSIVAIQVGDICATNDQHSNSSCKGTSELLHITRSNNDFLPLSRRDLLPMSPLQSVIMFYIDLMINRIIHLHSTTVILSQTTTTSIISQTTVTLQ